MSTVISFFNNKGGVGKTTTIWHLAVSLAEKGKKILMIDFDPQCNLSIAMLGNQDFADRLSTSRDIPYGKTIRAFALPVIQQNQDPKIYIAHPSKNKDLYPYPQNIHLIPGDFWLNTLADILSVGTDVISGSGLYKFLMLSRLIREVESGESGKYDFVLVDLPPSFNTLVRSALYSSDYFLVPCTPDLFSAYCVGLIGEILPKFIKDWEQGKASYLMNSPHDEFIKSKGKPKFGGWIFNGFDTKIDKQSGKRLKTGADDAHFERLREAVSHKLIPLLSEKITSYHAVPDFANDIPIAGIEDLNVMAPDSLMQNTPIQYLSRVKPTQKNVKRGAWSQDQKQFMDRMTNEYSDFADAVIERFGSPESN